DALPICLHLAATFGTHETCPVHRRGQPGGNTGPGGHVPAAEGGHDSPCRTAHHVQAEEGGGPGGEGVVGIKQGGAVQAGSGGDLGDGGVGGGALHRSGAAAVDQHGAAEFFFQGAHHGGTAGGQFA